jgi:hypothetical protein
VEYVIKRDIKYPGQRKTHYRPVENAKEEANHILNVCNSSREKLIVDSGATIHTCNNISLLSEVEECNREAVNASGQFIKFTMKGNMKVMLQNGESLKISLKLPSICIIQSLGLWFEKPKTIHIHESVDISCVSVNKYVTYILLIELIDIN